MKWKEELAGEPEKEKKVKCNFDSFFFFQVFKVGIYVYI
jgi:hypothetical protein